MSSIITLRERKKDATKTALADAALDLADKYGLAQLRIEDIADQAGVSLRTFRNYFPNKEAAVVGLLTHNYDLVVKALRDRPESEKLAWRNVFEYYVFGAAERAGEHLPPEARGVLGPIDDTQARLIRAMLMHKLNR